MAETTDVELLPSRISPSRITDFKQCPKLFHFKTILKIPTPGSIATARGTTAHTVLERIFDLAHEHRTPEMAQLFVEPAWQTMLEPRGDRAAVDPQSPEFLIREAGGLWADLLDDDSERATHLDERAAEYATLAPRGSDEEHEVIDGARKAVATYFLVERPANFDPEDRELHVEAVIDGLAVHGFIDRLDRYVTTEGEERWVISDYKTSKPPSPQDRGRTYFKDRFFAMKIYALLLTEEIGVTPYSLRLVYLGPSPMPTTNTIDQRPPLQASNVVKLLVTDEVLAETRAELAEIWGSITRSAESSTWRPTTGPLCDWCHFKDNDTNPCPAFRS